MKAIRLPENPIVSPRTPGWDADLVGWNINGPSLLRAPAWLPARLGNYYLYFAHHQGRSIRLAFADDLRGPWRIRTPGTLQLEQTGFHGHIASPDVHVDEAQRRLVMYYHGCPGRSADAAWGQPTMRAVSADGLQWTSDDVELGESYFRVFRHGGWHYAIAKGGRLYRSRDGTSRFDDSGRCVDGSGMLEGGRHWAVLPEGDRLHCFFSRWGDAPEHLVHATLALDRPWTQWRIDPPASLLRPEFAWEGSEIPVRPSTLGSAEGPVHELRDPAVFRDNDGRTYLAYSVAGESGIALAELG